VATSTYKEWLARGRVHQREGRAVDAMICYRRAAHSVPRAADPRYYLGEVLWQLGRTADARAAWHETTVLSPQHIAARQALAEASLVAGDLSAAKAAADAVLAKRPADLRANTISALAALDQTANGDERDRAAAALARLMPQAAAVLEVPYAAATLGRALSRLPATPGRVALVASLVQVADRLPPALLAAVVPALPRAVVERAIRERALRADEIDGLRSLAQALVIAGDDALGAAAAERYSGLCVQAFAPQLPVLWPRRTAGAALRVALLVSTMEPDGIALAGDVLARLDPATIDLTMLAAGDEGAVRAAIAKTPFAQAPFATMPALPDIASARAIAARDPDLLLDLAGFAYASGPLLAARPARAIWTHVVATPHPVTPLVDRIGIGDGAAWASDITAYRSAAIRSASSSVTAIELAARWDAAVAAHGNREYPAARDGYARVLAEQPGYVPALYLGGVLERDTGDSTAAAAKFEAALALAPDDHDSRVAAAQIALARQDADAAREHALAGLGRQPQHAGLLRVLGHAELARREGQAAVNAFAAAISADPFDGETHYNYGVALQMVNHLADAARAYQRALAFKPDLVDADFNLAIIFDRLGEIDAAVKALEHVLERQPTRAEAHRTLLDVLSGANRGDEWLRAFRRFEARCPSALGLVANALEAYQYQGDFATVDSYLQRLERDEFKPANELDLVDTLEQLLYLTLFFDLDPAARLSLYTTYDKAAQHVYGAPLPRRAERAPGRLRLGYLSADLRNHVMGKMVYEAVRHHDRKRFDIVFYSTSGEADTVTAGFKALDDRFVSLADLPDAEAVRRIAADDLDLLVDLSTHTKGARPAIVARKPARVQITHVASAGALGLSAVDFKLTDRFADPPANADWHLEALLPMAGCVYPFRHIAPATDHPFHRAALGIAPDAIVIGAFVSPLKLSRRTLALWREVLERVPRARLAFSPSAPWLRDFYPRLLKAAGIDEARAVMLPQGRDDAENQARYTLVDLVLDPMPFGGVNGVLEPLDMGVPVVTLCGRSHGERSAYSILSNLGVTATVAQTGREYTDIAVRLADDAAFMRDVRAQIQAGLAQSPLVDMVAHTRNLESAYIAALADKAPDVLAAVGIPVR
jgi:predicted O-linked N-acetylglucosamine transferase (SPINDLY family)